MYPIFLFAVINLLYCYILAQKKMLANSYSENEIVIPHDKRMSK